MPPDPIGDVLHSCAECGDELSVDVPYPVIAEQTADSEPVLRSFCDDGCRTAWEADR